MKLVTSIRTLALTALLFSSSCTSDGTEPVETVEEENRIPTQSDEVVDSELPSPEAASVEAQKAGEAIDSNSSGEVQNLSSDQQMAVDQSANGAGQEVAPASTAGAETAAAPSESPALPEAAIAAETTPASPVVPAEEVAPAEPIAKTSETAAAGPAAAKASAHKSKKSKKSQSSHARKTPSLSGNEKVYVVQPGDTLGSISTMLYGSNKEWKTLANLNGLNDAGLIFPGDALKYTASEASAAFEARYDGLAKVSVTVEKGDTLTKIAARVMGQAQFWKLLWRWNEKTLADPNKIAVGQTLDYVSAQDLVAASRATAEPAAAH